MIPEPYGVDYTGYGPTGIGNAPTGREMHQQALNRFYMDRMSLSMQFIDPYVRGASQSAQQIISGANSPEAARRALYGSAQGQLFLDSMMASRRMGLLGYGDPVNYASNIVRGITGGGFLVDFTGSMGGANVVGLGQRVYGQGPLAEQVSMSYAQGLLRDLYGPGSADPSRLFGFNMEEASGVFSTLAQRGGVGRAATVVRNATTQQRLDAARTAAVDPSIREFLSTVSAGDDTALGALIDAQTDPKFKRELEKIQKSTDAIFINQEGRRSIARTTEAVIEGMAALSDIYGELSAPELHQKLESISGMRITNLSQANRSMMMVNQLRGAALGAGMDPRAFMEFSAAQQLQLQQAVMQAGGFDARTATFGIGVTAQMHHQMMMESASSAQLSRDTAANAAALGFGDMSSTVKTVDEIYADKREGRLMFMNRYLGITMMRGGMDTLSGAQRQRAAEILAEFDRTTDPMRRQQLELMAQNVMGGSRGFRAAAASRIGQARIANAYLDPELRGAQDLAAIAGRTDALNLDPIADFLAGHGMGAADSVAMAGALVGNLGMEGMVDLARLAKSSSWIPEAARRQGQGHVLRQAGLSGADAEVIMGMMLEDDGTLSDSGRYGALLRMVGQADREGISVYGRSIKARNRMRNMSDSSMRVRLRGVDNHISVRSIITALSEGKVSSIRDREAMAYFIQALADEGFQLGGTDMGRVAAGLDFSGGLTPEGMDALERVYGGDLGLHTRLGFSSREALINASTGNEALLERALETLQGNPAYADMNVRGTLGGGLSAIFTDTYRMARETGDAEGLASKLHAAESLSGLLSGTEYNAMVKSIRTGEPVDIGMFEAGRWSGLPYRRLFSKFLSKDHPDKNVTWANIANSHRFARLAGIINAASGSELTGLSALNEDQALVGEMEKQLKAFQQAAQHDPDRLVSAISRNEAGEKIGTHLTPEFLESFTAAIEKLRLATNAEGGGQQEVGVMKVKMLQVDKIESIP